MVSEERDFLSWHSQGKLPKLLSGDLLSTSLGHKRKRPKSRRETSEKRKGISGIRRGLREGRRGAYD